MAQGLQDLKTVAEALPSPPEIKIIQFEGHPAAVINDSVTIDQFDGLLSNNFAELAKYLNRY